MSIEVYNVPTQTSAATTDSYDVGVIGKILKIELKCSASTDFKIYTTETDLTTASEYIIGTSGAAVTVADYLRAYPRTPVDDPDDGATAMTFDGTYTVQTEFVVNDNIHIAVSAIAAADTWSARIWVEK